MIVCQYVELYRSSMSKIYGYRTNLHLGLKYVTNVYDFQIYSRKQSNYFLQPRCTTSEKHLVDTSRWCVGLFCPCVLSLFYIAVFCACVGRQGKNIAMISLQAINVIIACVIIMLYRHWFVSNTYVCITTLTSLLHVLYCCPVMTTEDFRMLLLLSQPL